MTDSPRTNPPFQSIVDVKFISADVVRCPALLLLMTIIGGLFIVSQIYLAIPLTPSITADFDVSPEEAGWFGPAFGLAYAVGFLGAGVLADRYGAGRILVVGLIATAAATGVVVLVHGFWPMVSARAVQGLAASTFPPAALTLIATALPDHLRARGASLMGFAFLCAAPLAQLLATWSVEAAVPARSLLLAMAAGYLLCAAGISLTTRSSVRRSQPRYASGGTRSRLVPTRPLVAVWCAAASVLFALVTFYSTVAIQSADTGLDPQLVRLLGIPPFLVAFLVPMLARRWGPLRIAGVGLLLSALAMIVSGGGSTPAVLISAMLLPLGIGLAVPALIVSVATNAPAGSRGKANAVYMLLLFSGASIAPPFTQSLSEDGAPPAAWIVPALLLTMFAASLFAASRHQRRSGVSQ